jgi:fibronectin type 3 domain-containing protein
LGTAIDHARGGVVGILVASCLIWGCGYKTSPRPATATIPAEINLVDARGYPDKIVLRWPVPEKNSDASKLTDISGFKIYRSVQKNGECENCGEPKEMYANVDFQNPIDAVIEKGDIIYTDKNVSPGRSYTYYASVYNLRGKESKLSSDVTVGLESVPATPEDLQAVNESGRVRLKWSYPVDEPDIQGHRIYRGPEPDISEMKVIGSGEANQREFFDRDIEKDKTYHYAVRSFKMNRGVSIESKPSNIATPAVAAEAEQTPEKVSASITRDGVRVSWDPVSTAAGQAKYNVYRSETGRLYTKINPEPISGTMFTDRHLRRGRIYKYAVASITNNKESGRSVPTEIEYRR